MKQRVKIGAIAAVLAIGLAGYFALRDAPNDATAIETASNVPAVQSVHQGNQAPLESQENASDIRPQAIDPPLLSENNLPNAIEAPQLETDENSAIPDIFQPPNPQAFVQQDAAIISQNSQQPPVIFTAATLSLQSVLPPGTAPNPETATPRFDIVRIDVNGTALVAGQAAPHALITIMSGGKTVAEVTASELGEFVAFLDVPSQQPENMALEDGVNSTQGIVSQAQIIILPQQDEAAPTAPVVVLATQDSVQIIQPSGLSVPDNISLDTISYNTESDVVLAGRGTPNHIARVYADGELVGNAAISESGSWGIALNNLAAGRYVLRVDELTSDGTVSSRVETPFQREFPEALALSEFAQGAKVIVQPGNTLWLMATQAYGDGDYYTQIFAANKDAIRDPNLIYPGQVVSIPNVSE